MNNKPCRVGCVHRPTAGFVVFSGVGPQSDYNGDSDVDGAALAGFAAEFGN